MLGLRNSPIVDCLLAICRLLLVPRIQDSPYQAYTTAAGADVLCLSLCTQVYCVKLPFVTTVPYYYWLGLQMPVDTCSLGRGNS